MHSLIAPIPIVSLYILTGPKGALIYLYQASPTDVL